MGRAAGGSRSSLVGRNGLRKTSWALPKTYGDNPQRVADLPLRVLYLRQSKSVPATTRDTVFSQVDRGERPTERDKQLVKEGRQATAREAADRKALRKEAADLPACLKAVELHERGGRSDGGMSNSAQLPKAKQQRKPRI